MQRPPLELEPRVQLLPDACVGPLGRILVGRALEIEAADLLRAEAVQREPALVARVDQFVARRRDGREDSEPAERVLARVRREDAGRDAVAAHAVEPVATGDHVALELVRDALVQVADARPLGIQVVHRDVSRLEQERPFRREASGDEVLHDFLLAVDRDAPAREVGERDPVPAPLEAQLDPVMNDALAVQALGHAHLGQQVDGSLLEHARPDALLDVLAAARLEDDGVDALQVQQVRKRQTRRPGADDRYLRAHRREPSVTGLRRSPPPTS